MIPVEKRIRMIILLEKMKKQQSFSKKLGIKDTSKYHGEYINKEESGKLC